MNIEKKFFPAVLKENTKNYFAQFEGMLLSVDEHCSMLITFTNYKYIFRIAPSHPVYTNIIIEEIIKYHNMLGIRLDFSKSIKTTAVILFNLKLES
tara:strand:+ start:277 stop:564 length:288 start_codon:yes stop_codon:yes gene_type:complete